MIRSFTLTNITYFVKNILSQTDVDEINNELNNLRTERNKKDSSWGEYGIYSHPHKESELILMPIANKRIIKVEKEGLYIKLERFSISITNHQYNYMIEIPYTLYEKLVNMFDTKMDNDYNYEEQVMMSQLEVGIDNVLKHSSTISTVESVEPVSQIQIASQIERTPSIERRIIEDSFLIINRHIIFLSPNCIVFGVGIILSL